MTPGPYMNASKVLSMSQAEHASADPAADLGERAVRPQVLDGRLALAVDEVEVGLVDDVLAHLLDVDARPADVVDRPGEVPGSASGISGTSHVGSPGPVWTKTSPLCSRTGKPPRDTLGVRRERRLHVHRPSASNRHPWNGHTTVPSTTFPPTPRCAP
jgi:hypothetical protein